MSRKKEPIKAYLLILDLICITISFQLATWTRYGFKKSVWFGTAYGLVFILLVLSYICIYFFFNDFNNFFKSGFLDEFTGVFNNNVVFGLLLMGILFIYQKGALYSRAFFACFFFYNVCVDYVARQYFKIIILTYYKKSNYSNKVIIITTARQAGKIIDSMGKQPTWEYNATGIVVMDKDMQGAKIRGIPVIANKDNLYEIIAKEAVDEIFISMNNDKKLIKNGISLDEMILEFENMGIIVNLGISGLSLRVKEKTVKDFAGYHVLTFSTKVFNKESMMLKRGMDIIGAMVGIVLTLIIGVIIAPAIRIESPGKLVFSQIRIGKNGRRFKLYKFRSMYADAEARKQELQEKNEMEGPMFKISDDPRITKVGKFIRKTSIDELPQFFNVLRGEMSLVGTRPPTEDEFLQYEGRHKRRLALKPGITGLWQVSGRSDIENFEEVVKMDLEYIDNWSLGMDIHLILKTITVVFFQEGAK